MPNPDYIYGDRQSFMAAPTGRAKALLCVGDSIINGWYPEFVRRFKGLRGFDTQWKSLYYQSNGLGPITAYLSGSAYFDSTHTYNIRENSGSSTLSSSVAIGATTLPVNQLSAFIPLSGGLPAPTMSVTIGTGGGAETVYVDLNYTGWPSSSPTILVKPALTKAHSSGDPVVWARRSGCSAYYLNGEVENVFATASSPQSATYNADPLIFHQMTGGFSPANEATDFDDGFILDRFSIDVTLFYLALPQNAGTPNLRMWGRNADASSPVDTTVDFSIYAGTPTIRAVSLTMPAPTNYGINTVPVVTVNSPNPGNFTFGQVFAPIMLVMSKHGVTDGTILLNTTAGGMAFGDLTGDPTTWGPQWSPTWRRSSRRP